ncbi:MAG TPA: histidine phosphatase family protein [Candidatus Dormibacteraeota bacterium]|nr:histidine phosphatase family protein [Candidatus Dormibacteraeota bacterium]
MSDHVRVVLLRHGETEWSRALRHTGRSDIPLDEQGRRAAREVGRALAGIEFTRVLVSPLGRARETAELAALRGPVEICDDLVEWDYGEYEGRTSAEIDAERPGWSLWTDGVIGGETLDEVAARCDRVVARLQELEGDVAAVAHGHVLRVLAARWAAQPAALAQRLVLGTARLGRLGHEHGARAITLWNSASP